MAQGRVYVDDWVVGDGISSLRINLKKVDRTVYDLTGVTAATLEMRSKDGQASFSLACTLPSPLTLGYVDVLPGSASWTAPTGKTRELFECWVKLVKTATPGWLKPSFTLSLRTAP